MNKKKAFIVTDSFLYKNGYTKPITDKLDELGIVYTCFYDVAPDLIWLVLKLVQRL